MALCRALAADRGVRVTACVVSEGAVPPAAADALARLAERHGVQVEHTPEPMPTLEASLYARLAYRFYLWARDRGFDAIHAVDLYGLPYYCLLARQAGRHFTGTAFGLLALGPSPELLLDRGDFPQPDSLHRFWLEEGCRQAADRVQTLDELALPAAETAAEPPRDRLPGDGLCILVLGDGLTDADLRFTDKALAQAWPHLAQSPRSAQVILADLAPRWESTDPLPGVAPRLTIQRGGEDTLPTLVRQADVVVLPSATREAAWLAVLCGAVGVPVVGRGHPALTVFSPGLAPSGPPDDLARRLLAALDGKEPAPPPRPLPQLAPLPVPHGRSFQPASPPLVSVCISHFNRPHRLRDALASLAAQDYPALEVVLVDDGSDQPEAQAALKALEQAPPLPAFRLIRQPNRYLGAARNTAAAAARGTYLLFMDDDNLAKPDELSVLVAAAETAGAEIVTCFNDTFSQEDNGQPVAETRRLFLGPAVTAGVLSNVFGDANALIRADAFHRLGGFGEEYGVGHEDYEFFARAALAGARFLTVPEALFWYRVDPASMIKTTVLGLNHARALRPYLAGDELTTMLALLARGSFIDTDRTVALLQDEGQRKQAAIAVLEAANSDKQAAIAALETANAEKQAAIVALGAANAEKQAAIAALETANAEKQAAIVALEAANAEKQAAIAALETANAETQAILLESQASAAQRQATLDAVFASWSWRLTKPLRGATRLARRLLRMVSCRSHPMSVTLGDGVEVKAGLYHSLTEDPQLHLQPAGGRMPRGWTLVTYTGRGIDTPLMPELYLDVGTGFSEAGKLVLPPLRDGQITQILAIPEGVRALRFDPLSWPGRFQLDRVEVRSCGGLVLLALLLLRQPRALLAGLAGPGPRRLNKAMEQAVRVDNAVPSLTYEDWTACFDSLDEEDQRAIRQKSSLLTPRFTVILPAQNTSHDGLCATIKTIQAQLYPHWRLLVVGTTARSGAEWQADPRILVTPSLDALGEGEDWIVWVEPTAHLAPHALYVMAQCLATHPDTEVLYADEDRLDGRNRRTAPLFKPDWSPDLFLARNYLGPLVVLHKRLIMSVLAGVRGQTRTTVEDLAYAAMLERLTHQRDPVVRHLPFVLAHRPAKSEGHDQARRGRERAMLAEHLARQTTPRHGPVRVEPWLNGTANHLVYPLPEPAPLVSIIVPTKDKIELLRLCIDSLHRRTVYPGGFEILVLDNRSETDEARAYFAELERTGAARVLSYDAPFNYSAINNFGVRHAKGSVLAFLNNDIETISPGWLTEMTAHALREEVGAVGSLLYYPDDTIQHAGVGLGLYGLVGHLHRGLPRGDTGYTDRAALTQNLSAVTAACLVMRRSLFEKIGGFEEAHLHVAFNDIDLCLRLRAAGYRVVWTPHAEMYHHEGASRGREERPERLAQFAVEIAYMMEHWAKVAASDPYYSPNLTLDADDCGLAWPPRATLPWRQPQSSCTSPDTVGSDPGRSDLVAAEQHSPVH